MLTHPTLDQLRALRLDGMVQAFIELEAQEAARDLAHAEWLALLLDREAANRNTRRFQIRLRSARLRHAQAVIEDVDYGIDDKSEMRRRIVEAFDQFYDVRQKSDEEVANLLHELSSDFKHAISA